MSTLRTKILRSSIFWLALALLPLEAMAAVGRIYYTSGGVYIERSGQKIPVVKDILLESGDVIVTEGDGRAQWRMADDSYFAIRPDTRFKIDEYQEPAGGSGGKAFYSLLKGGFRSITGLIGKSDHASYRVNSTVATMGVRGTDHTHVLCQDDCGWVPGGNPANGLYSRVDEGSSIVSNAEGTLDVKAGQYAETASPPRLVNTAPGVFFNWAVDFRIDIGLALGFEHKGVLRIEPIVDCLPVPSPNQPCP
jgi:hypothetical protein